MKNRRSTKFALAVGGLAMAAVAISQAGSIAAGDAGSDNENFKSEAEFLRGSEVTEAQAAALAAFEGTFPPGYEEPALEAETDRLTEKGNGGLVSFEAGYPESQVITAWRCSWEDVYLKALKAGDQQAAEAALSQLRTFYDLEWTKIHVIDPDRMWEKTVIDSAAGGDLRELEADVESCLTGPLSNQYS